MSHLVHLKSEQCSLVVQLQPEPAIVYWGKGLPIELDDSLLAATDLGIPQARLDKSVGLSLMQEPARGLFGSPGLEGHRQGQDWAPIFQYQHHRLDGQNLEIELADPIADLAIKIEIFLDAKTNVFGLRQSLKNTALSNYTVNRLACTIPMPERSVEVMSFHGRWGKEFETQRQLLKHGSFVQENRRGRTSHEYFPGIMSGVPGFSHEQGEVWAMHLAWSGNHRLRAEVKSDGRRLLQTEALYEPGEVILQTQESLTTPWLYGSYSDGGINDISHNFHRYLRQHIIRFSDSKPRPIHLNTWEGIYFDHDPTYINKMVEQAAAIGVERFIIDDGWFRGRDHERAALGDWFVDKKKYPEGLNQIIDQVKGCGMEFGLWFEPEMVSVDSELNRQHPDWILAMSGYEQPTGRWQYVLNLQNPEVFAYLYGCIDDLLSEYDIRYIKWDMNRELVQAGHQGRAAANGQTLALYRLLDKLRHKHPGVEIESCASGGGRIDMEILKRSHRFWSSDNNDALERQPIQQAMSYFFPPEVMGAHIGNETCHTTRRRHSIGYRSLTALWGHMGLEFDPLQEPAETLPEYQRYLELHKQLRPLLHSGRVFSVDMPNKDIIAFGVAGEQSLVLGVAQQTMPEYAYPGVVRVPLLQANRRYKVTVLDMPDTKTIAKEQPSWIDEPIELSAEVLANIGLRLPILDPASAMLIQFELCAE